MHSERCGTEFRKDDKIGHARKNGCESKAPFNQRAYLFWGLGLYFPFFPSVSKNSMLSSV